MFVNMSKMRVHALGAVLVLAALLFSYLYVVHKQRIVLLFSRPEVKKVNEAPKIKSVMWKCSQGQESGIGTALSPEGGLTVVTAFFNIGSFRKGNEPIRSPMIYRQWIKIFHRLNNPVIAFFDDQSDAKMFAKLRSILPSNMTKIVKIDPRNLWSFSFQTQIDKIYRKPSYPKHLPNTVNASYSCAMHVKYDLMEIAIRENPFKTHCFCWLDIGYFRDEVKLEEEDQPFSLGLPPKFDQNKIAYNQVGSLNSYRTSKQIVASNSVWVGGGFFIGRQNVMVRWVKQYKTFFLKMLQTGYISTDQQVLYYMNQETNRRSTAFDVEIQPYKGPGPFNDKWFNLGYLSVLCSGGSSLFHSSIHGV